MNFFEFIRVSRLAAVILALASVGAWSQPMGMNLKDEGTSSSDVSLPAGGGRVGLPSAASDFNEAPSAQPPYVGDYAVDESLYKVGPGDVFQIVVEGSSFERQINPEGNVVLGRVGVVYLKGLSLKEARKRILDNLETTYKRRNCSVSLSRAKTMRVFITGAVNAPGTYDISGTARVYDAVQKAGGFSATAQTGIVEIREGTASRTIQVGAFMLKGDLESNPYVVQGSVLHVPFLDYDKPWVRIKGDAGFYNIQMEPGETAADLLRKAYSYRTVPAYLALLVKEKEGKEAVLTAAEAEQYQPKAQASIEVFSAQEGVFVGGAVAAPGRQPFLPDQKVIEYISKAGILTMSRVPRKINVIRGNGSRESLSLQDSGVRPGDVIIVGQNAEQKFLLYTPILLSIVSLALVVVQIYDLR
jgi:protein involved in polysaccharide export with SLBB domain